MLIRYYHHTNKQVKNHGRSIPAKKEGEPAARFSDDWRWLAAHVLRRRFNAAHGNGKRPFPGHPARRQRTCFYHQRQTNPSRIGRRSNNRRPRLFQPGPRHRHVQRRLVTLLR